MTFGNGQESSGLGTPPGRSTVEKLLLVGVVVAVVQVVLMALAFYPAPHTGGDNAGYLTLAHSLLERGAYLDLYDPAEPPHTKYPPIFPAILALAMLLGAKSWMAFKMIPGAFTTLAIVFAFLWAQERRGLAFGAAVALLVGISDAYIYGSQWILSDPTFAAMTFLALWAFERARDDAGPRWLALGIVAAVLAYFTRSAGLPLLVGVGIWLALRRRWKGLAVLAITFGVPAFLWWLRGRGLGGQDYLSEFWFVDPYRPELGRIDVVEFLWRIAENAQLYLGAHIPLGMIGLQGVAPAIGGWLLAMVAIVGWIRRMLRGPELAEFFTPLYLGLLLVWPSVWGGDRFALPLFPLILFYAGETLLHGAGRLHKRLPVAAGGVGIALVAVPAAFSWTSSVAMARECGQLIDQEGPFACHGIGTREFIAITRWSGENLPDDAVVFSRKPRLFYVVSGGVPSRRIPLTHDPLAFRDGAVEAGAHFVVSDDLDALTPRYLFPVIRAWPELFCSLVTIPREETVYTELLGLPDLGIAPPPEEGASERVDVGRDVEEEDQIPAGQEDLQQDPGEEEELWADPFRACPMSLIRARPRIMPPVTSLTVPLLGAQGR